jgi:beta-galactosidase GanA
MKQAGITAATVGVFSWVSLQPAEDQFTFEWLDEIMDGLHRNGIKVILATPTAAQPAWMSQKYPTVLRAHEVWYSRTTWWTHQLLSKFPGLPPTERQHGTDAGGAVWQASRADSLPYQQ